MKSPKSRAGVVPKKTNAGTGKKGGNNVPWATYPEQSHRSRSAWLGPSRAPCSSFQHLRDALKLCPGLRDSHHYPSLAGKLRHREKNYLVQYPRENQWQSRFKTGSNFFHKITFYKKRREWGSSSEFSFSDNWHNPERKKCEEFFFFLPTAFQATRNFCRK